MNKWGFWCQPEWASLQCPLDTGLPVCPPESSFCKWKTFVPPTLLSCTYLQCPLTNSVSHKKKITCCRSTYDSAVYLTCCIVRVSRFACVCSIVL